MWVPTRATSDVVRSNGLSQVTVHPMGLSSQDGELTLYVDSSESGFHSPTMAHTNGTPVPVRVRRLDDCLDEWGIDAVDLMKIDVEGHEAEVFRGGERSLRSGRVRAIVCEFNEYWLREQGSSAEELHRMLTEFGFVDQHGTPTFGPDYFMTRFLIHRSCADI
jgi:FkbM family methyltransferase